MKPAACQPVGSYFLPPCLPTCLVWAPVSYFTKETPEIVNLYHWHQEAELEDFCWRVLGPHWHPLLGFRLPCLSSREYQGVGGERWIWSQLMLLWIGVFCLVLRSLPPSFCLGTHWVSQDRETEISSYPDLEAAHWLCWTISPKLFGLKTGDPFLVTKGERMYHHRSLWWQLSSMWVCTFVCVWVLLKYR